MDIYLLDKNFNVVRVIDEYISVIWTTRYYTSGEFELYIGANKDVLDDMKFGYYLVREQDITDVDEYHNVMVVQNREIITDAESGDTMIFTGQCLKSILRRRVMQQTIYTTANTLRDDLWHMVYSNFTVPQDQDRYLKINMGTDRITNTYNINCQITGKTVLDAVSDLCTTYGYGFDMYIKGGEFYLYFFEGYDRSYAQDVNPYVVFSPEFDNLISCDYKDVRTDYANVAYVAGEGEGAARKIAEVGSKTGLDRIEIWVDARNASSNSGAVSQTDYMNQLKQDGRDALAERKKTTSFEGTLNNRVNYELDIDYYLGDIVQIENAYGLSAHARIVEVIESDDETGKQIIPTFSEMEVTS